MGTSITYNGKIPADGNPNGIVDAPQGACFYKNGTFYKINHSGSGMSGWVEAYFKTYNVPNYYLTKADMTLLAVDTGSYLYVKNSIKGTTFGWELLSNKSPFHYGGIGNA